MVRTATPESYGKWTSYPAAPYAVSIPYSYFQPPVSLASTPLLFKHHNTRLERFELYQGSRLKRVMHTCTRSMTWGLTLVMISLCCRRAGGSGHCIHNLKGAVPTASISTLPSTNPLLQ